MSRCTRRKGGGARWSRHVWLGAWVLVAAGGAHAHGLDAGRVILRVTGHAAVLVVTPPTHAFADSDDDGNGLLHVNEVRRHRADILQRFEERVRLRDQEGVAPRRTFADVVVPHAFDGSAPRGSDHLRFIYRYRWPAPPRTVSFHYDLFEPGARDELWVQASRRPVLPAVGQGDSEPPRVETAVLTLASPRHLFFGGAATARLPSGDTFPRSAGEPEVVPSAAAALVGSGLSWFVLRRLRRFGRLDRP